MIINIININIINIINDASSPLPSSPPPKTYFHPINITFTALIYAIYYL